MKFKIALENIRLFLIIEKNTEVEDNKQCSETISRKKTINKNLETKTDKQQKRHTAIDKRLQRKRMIKRHNIYIEMWYDCHWDNNQYQRQNKVDDGS